MHRLQNGGAPQVWNQLREGELLSCDSCSRLLYWDPALAPAPKAPQPELIPGAGRAPRKPAWRARSYVCSADIVLLPPKPLLHAPRLLTFS